MTPAANALLDRIGEQGLVLVAEDICAAAELINLGLAEAEDEAEGPRLRRVETETT